jgi:hypothetical protein
LYDILVEKQAKRRKTKTAITFRREKELAVMQLLCPRLAASCWDFRYDRSVLQATNTKEQTYRSRGMLGRLETPAVEVSWQKISKEQVPH